MRLNAFGETVSHLATVAEVTGVAVAHVALTDDQFLNFFNRNSLMSTDLVAEIKVAFSHIDCADDDTVTSAVTRDALTSVRDRAKRTRDVYDELLGMTGLEQFSRFHKLALTIYQGLLDLYQASMQGLVAVTLEQLGEARRDLQSVLDRVALLASEMASELATVDVERLGADQIDRRLKAFTGKDGAFEHSGLPDLAAALEAGLREGRSWNELGNEAMKQFRGLAVIDASSLPEEQGLLLYMIAAEMSSTDDPATIRRRASVLLDLLRQSLHQTPSVLAGSFAQADVEIQHAITCWLNQRDSILATNLEGLAPEAIGQLVVTSYHTILEGVFRRLLTPFLEAAFSLRGDSDPREKVMTADLGQRIQWIKDWSPELNSADGPRLRSLLAGVNVALRNSVAHGDVELIDGVVVVHERHRITRALVGHEELPADNLIDRMKNLMLTCQAMRVAFELFRIEFRERLPAAAQLTGTRVVAEAATQLVGLWGLVKASVDRQNPKHVTVRCETAPSSEVRESLGYLVASCTLATLFSSSETVTLIVVSGQGATLCTVRVSTDEVMQWQLLPEAERGMWTARLLYRSSLDPLPAGLGVGYEGSLTRTIARLLMLDLAKLQGLRERVPFGLQAYTVALRKLLRQLTTAQKVLESVEAPQGCRPIERKLLEALKLTRRGLTEHERHIVYCRPQMIHIANTHLAQAARLISDLSQPVAN